MRDTYYADKRDLEKWGTLAYLAECESLPLIVQVPFLRLDRQPRLLTQDGEVLISPHVWSFFRDVKDVERLGERIGRRIVVLDEPFSPQERGKYRLRIVRAIEHLHELKVVLLDPDTGIEPSKAKPEHATVRDVQAAWKALRLNDWLVLYQHATRQPNWRERARSEFANACGISDVEVVTSPGITSDVAFLAVQKTRTRPSQKVRLPSRKP